MGIPDSFRTTPLMGVDLSDDVIPTSLVLGKTPTVLRECCLDGERP